ncbi:MAG TPA: MFS transporter [Thermomicrobiaceae bacterium]|nr:MFS transporter [Thermomicrobiaceae bacterium]
MAAETSTARPGTTLGLIGAGHLMSHFWQLTLPPLFPVLAVVFHVNFLQLGLLMTGYTVANAACQVPFGYLADRYGPKPILVGGLLLDGVAFSLCALAPNYAVLVVLVMLAGVGQAVYHPSDYAILSALFPRERAGKPYSIHTFTGYAGGAVAPIAIASLNRAFGWQVALVVAGLLGIVVALIVATTLTAPRLEAPVPAPATAGAARAPRGQGLRLLISQALLLLLGFFVFTSMFSSGLQSFLPTTLTKLYPVTIDRANVVLTVYLTALALSVLVGGVIADRVQNHARVIAVSFAAGMVLMFLIALVHLPIWAIFPLFALVGALQGVVMPSRDKMVREATPEGSAGKSFGFVSVGLSLGGIVSLPLLGALLDRGDPRVIFWVLALCILAAALTVLVTSLPGHARSRAGERLSA